MCKMDAPKIIFVSYLWYVIELANQYVISSSVGAIAVSR